MPKKPPSEMGIDSRKHKEPNMEKKPNLINESLDITKDSELAPRLSDRINDVDFENETPVHVNNISLFVVAMPLQTTSEDIIYSGFYFRRSADEGGDPFVPATDDFPVTVFRAYADAAQMAKVVNKVLRNPEYSSWVSEMCKAYSLREGEQVHVVELNKGVIPPRVDGVSKIDEIFKALTTQLSQEDLIKVQGALAAHLYGKDA